MDQTSEDENSPLIFEAPKPRKWRSPRLLFVIFRLCLAVYTGLICILSLVYFPHKNPHRPWIVWLTNWSYLTLTCHEIFSATIVLVHSTDRTTGCCCKELEDGADKDDETKRRATEKRRDETDSLPFYMKLSWLLYSVAAPVAINTTILILATVDVRHIPVKDFNNHIMNSVVVLLEVCLAALPVRLLHFVYSTIFYSIYFLFAYIFWSFEHNQNVLYPALIDWNEPEDTMMNWLSMALFRPIAVNVFLFCVYRLKLFICSKIYGDEQLSYE